ncbi:MAG: hypothetical protein WAM14_00870 [Candidatus Nitrosopolaris sp.]
MVDDCKIHDDVFSKVLLPFHSKQDSKHSKQQPKPVREDSFSSELIFAKTDFAFVDNIVDLGRKERSGPKGYRPSSIFMALLLMYLQSMESILDLVRFLNVHNQ